jgi:hypothetical protein
MVTLLVKCNFHGDMPSAPSPVASAPSPVASAPSIRVATAGASVPVAVAPVASAPVAVAPVAGNRAKLSARPLLERMNFDGPLAAKLGIGFMGNLMIEQIQGGPNDGMFVAHDALAKLLGTRGDSANRKLKTIVCPVPEPINDKQREENRQKEANFPSRTILKSGSGAVSLVNFLVYTSTNKLVN